MGKLSSVSSDAEEDFDGHDAKDREGYDLGDETNLDTDIFELAYLFQTFRAHFGSNLHVSGVGDMHKSAASTTLKTTQKWKYCSREVTYHHCVVTGVNARGSSGC